MCVCCKYAIPKRLCFLFSLTRLPKWLFSTDKPTDSLPLRSGSSDWLLNANIQIEITLYVPRKQHTAVHDGGPDDGHGVAFLLDPLLAHVGVTHCHVLPLVHHWKRHRHRETHNVLVKSYWSPTKWHKYTLQWRCFCSNPPSTHLLYVIRPGTKRLYFIVWRLILAIFVVYREWVNLTNIGAWCLVLWTSLLYRQRYILSFFWQITFFQSPFE